MPTFRKTYERYRNPNIRIFEKHIDEKGYDVSQLWSKVDDAILKIVLNTEKNVIKMVTLNQRFLLKYYPRFELSLFGIISNIIRRSSVIVLTKKILTS
jgi:hypothetical protein